MSQQQWLPPTAPEPSSWPPVTPEQSYAPAPEPEQPHKQRRWFGPIGVAAIALFSYGAKLKFLLLALPKLKLLTTSGTMLVSIAAYSLFWGWTFALGFVLLLFVHEMGHVIQLRREGVKASAPMFIPFLGAAVFAKSLGGNALAEARVGLAGPVLGTLGAAALIPVWIATDNDFWAALAFTGFFLNLFNLLPVLPLDGGRAMAAMAPWMWFVGFAAMIALAVFFPNPILLLVILFGGMETWRRWKSRRRGEGEEGNEAYYKVAPKHRLMVAAVYIGLIVVLGVGMTETFVERSLDEV